jgi:hypothetical protein
MNKHHAWLTRRDFVCGTVGAVVGASALTGESSAAQTRPVRSSRVIVVREQAVQSNDHVVDKVALKRMLGETLQSVTGEKSVKSAWLSLVKPGDTVGLVPTPHLNPTHQELIELVQESLVEAGIPKEHIVNAQRGPETPKSCTALIAMPGLKAHWLTGIGTVLKNYIVYSGNPASYHDANNVKLGEIWNMPHVRGKTRLVLVDALYPLCDKGPQPDPRYKWNYNGLIAGIDPVAVETICLNIITRKRQALRQGEPWPLSPPPLCVAAADERYNLGTSKMEEIKVSPIGWAQDLLL